MHLNNFSCISLASHYIFKRQLWHDVMKTSFINNILNSQPILIKFTLKLFVCKCLSCQTHLLLALRFPLNSFVQVLYILKYWTEKANFGFTMN